MSDHAKNRLRKSTVGGSSPETLSRIKGTVTVIHSTNRVLLCTPLNYGHCPLNSGTAGSHPKERVSGELPRALAHSRNSQCPPTKILCQHSALSAAYPLLGWLPAVRFIPCKGYAADKAWAGHERLESANLCVTRLTAPVRLSLQAVEKILRRHNTVLRIGSQWAAQATAESPRP